MATNPNPKRISTAMWDRLIVPCCNLTTTVAMKDEQAGVWVRQPGSHADATWLLANRPNDYSLQGPKQRVFTPEQGRYGRAWDWGFPSAWSGDWSQIGIYSLRIKAAWETNDPRTYMLFEVLCQTPEDRQPEGYVFYPVKKFRVPDRSHETHMHIGVLTVYCNDPVAMADLFSLLSGEPLATWRARRNSLEDDMAPLLFFAKLAGNDTVHLVDNFMTNRWVTGAGFPVLKQALTSNGLGTTIWEWPNDAAHKELLGVNLDRLDDDPAPLLATLTADQLLELGLRIREGVPSLEQIRAVVDEEATSPEELAQVANPGA
ncbi:hypothetical protein GCM10009557_05810 [Virgisporangium ochraceum]|uniref:Uncharacterized protein n=1 Tax=Virgisporangium ochraceum TaxID=65505 RepID=A0A8J4E9E6_9ACTN|nr:hypothetical protein [Virgisporangium ochraceum]GIJ66238.1 hypothetical protein Voc01_011550 [Virgisporangium ochraceum]